MSHKNKRNQSRCGNPSRRVVKVVGASGQGINSIGEMLAKALKDSGYYVFGYREYPSLIRGGTAAYQLEISDHPVNSPSAKCDIMIGLDRASLHHYHQSVAHEGTIVHTIRQMDWLEAEQEFFQQKNIQVAMVDAQEIAENEGGSKIMINTVMIGLLWQLFDLDLTILKELLTHKFAKKKSILNANIRCLEAGFNYQSEEDLTNCTVDFKQQPAQDDSYLISGNETLALGALQAGMRAFYAYPMTPATSIHSYLSKTAKQSGILIKQAEDEISAAQMALGSMFAGTRALTATSGGGFDLMTETVSLAGMTETPWVCVVAQRPGPATGLPTWTGAGDLNLAVYGGHGEFPRCVIAVSDAGSAFYLIQKAFNLAEEYQLPVIVLTEKQIAESLFNLRSLPTGPGVSRGLVPDHELGNLESAYRYADTKEGVSLRWLPGQNAPTYLANSDEHSAGGDSTESAEITERMMAKRMRKLNSLKKHLPDPRVYGAHQPDILLVGWGSAKNAVLDAMSDLQRAKSKIKVTYLHYEYMFPLKTKKFKQLQKKAKHIALIENNYQGQLGELLRLETGYRFRDKLLKFNGRPFWVDDVRRYIIQLILKNTNLKPNQNEQ